MKGSIAAHVLAYKANSTPPPRHMAKPLAVARNEEMETDVDEVAAKLKALGYDPLEKLAEARNDPSLNLTDQQRATIDRWVMPYRYPQKKAVELTGADGGALTVQLVKFADPNPE